MFQYILLLQCSTVHYPMWCIESRSNEIIWYLNTISVYQLMHLYSKEYDQAYTHNSLAYPNKIA